MTDFPECTCMLIKRTMIMLMKIREIKNSYVVHKMSNNIRIITHSFYQAQLKGFHSLKAPVVCLQSSDDSDDDAPQWVEKGSERKKDDKPIKGPRLEVFI